MKQNESSISFRNKNRFMFSDVNEWGFSRTMSFWWFILWCQNERFIIKVPLISFECICMSHCFWVDFVRWHHYLLPIHVRTVLHLQNNVLSSFFFFFFSCNCIIIYLYFIFIYPFCKLWNSIMHRILKFLFFVS